MLNAAIFAGALLRRFRNEDEGAMTVEWVAIAAAVTVGAVALAWGVLESLDPVSGTIGTSLSNAAGSITASPTADGSGIGDGS